MKSRIATISAVTAAILLGVSYWSLRGAGGGSDSGSAVAVSSTQTPHPVSFSLAVAATTKISNFPVFQVRQGQWLTLKITAARAGSVHVHIYEKMIDLQPGSEVALTFQAVNAGRFPIHLHDPAGAMEHLATLEVQPRWGGLRRSDSRQ